MRFTVTGHSTLFVETSGPTVLVDPWFAGSCYWRSWWHFPPTGDVDPGWLHPDFVYLTHDHFDHFHYPTVRRLSRDTTFLIPRFGVDIMLTEVRRLGFRNIVELPSGEPYELAPGVRVASYQYGFDDTLFVVADRDAVLFDVNDCKIRGAPLRKVVEDFGRPDVALKSHSFAQGFPNCYSAEDPADLGRITRQTFLDDFTEAIDELSPRFAVPFASMVALLHPESRHCNEFIISPPEVKAAYEAIRPASATQVVTMAPDDAWDSSTGFERSDFDWYAERETHLGELAEIASAAVARSLHEESERALPFAAFAAFFGEFLRALPPLSGRLAIKRPIVFVPGPLSGDCAGPYWVIDIRNRRVYESASLPADSATVIRVAPGVLADAMANLIVHYIHISMRFRTELRPSGIGDDLAFWGLLTIWELGYLPLRNLARPRMLDVAWRRRREFAQMARAAVGGQGSLASRMSGQLATSGGDS